MEKEAFDPMVGGRQEEIWARMSGVREQAQRLQEDTERIGKAVEGQQNGEVLSDEDQKALEKVRTFEQTVREQPANFYQLLKDYDRQLDHLKKWVDDTRQEYEEWDKDRKPAKPTGR